MPDQFTWDPNQEDENIHAHGTVIAWGQGRSTAIQRFVEALSARIGAKVDWSYTGGRAHLDVLPEHRTAAVYALHDKTFVESFQVPYSEETWSNGTYFRLDTIAAVDDQ